METVNESAKLIAQALELLYDTKYIDYHKELKLTISTVVSLLEQTLDKLTVKL